MALISTQIAFARYPETGLHLFSHDGQVALISLVARGMESEVVINGDDIRALAVLFKRAADALDEKAREDEAIAEYRAKQVMRGLEAEAEIARTAKAEEE